MRRIGQRARRAQAAQKEAQRLQDAVRVDEFGTTTDYTVLREAEEKREKQKQHQRDVWEKRIAEPEKAQEMKLKRLIRDIARKDQSTPKRDDELKDLKTKAVEKVFQKGNLTKEHLENVAKETFANYIPRAQRSVASKSANSNMSM